MKRFLLLLVVFTPILIHSQEEKLPIYTISGKIIDASTKLPVEDATVIFKNLNTSQIAFGGITNKRGKFSVEVEKGTYNATVEYISYKTKKLNISTITRDLHIGTISLEIDTKFLNEVEIIAEKRTLEFKQNKIVYNVDKDIAAAGSMATDVLNNIPSVAVSPDGSITLRGQANVLVMINGKISSLSKPDALKSLPAGSIENIEVHTSPGASFKASALGVINIILKKGKNEGLNSSITTSGGFKDYYGGLLTLNHKSKKVNFYTNTSYFRRNPISLTSFENEYFSNGITSAFLTENSENNRKGKGFYSTIGVDFYLSDKTTFSTNINYQNINNNNKTLTNSNFFDANKVPTLQNERTHIGKLDNELIEFIVDFQHNFKKQGKKIIASVVHTNDVDTFSNNITNSSNSFTNENYIEKNTLKNTIFDIQFSNTIGKTSNYAIGYNGEFGEIPFTYSGTITNEDIHYSENIHAAFVEFENQSEKFYIGLGLRAEFAEIKLDYTNLNTKLTKLFEDLFPSVYLEYTISDTKNIYISYSRKVTRPTYALLQPFEQKFSETSSYKGNENINPMYIDMVNLGYVFYGNKFVFAPTLFFNRYNEYFQDVTYETGEQINGVNKVITTPFNVGKFDYYGIQVFVTYRASTALNFTGNIRLAKMEQFGTFETVNLANDNIRLDYNFSSPISGTFGLQAQLKIPNVFNFQTNIKHDLISKGPFSTRKARTYANMAINRDLFDKTASISLTVDDIFKSNITDRDRFDTNYFSKSTIEPKHRTIILSFTYRFNQSKKDRKIDFGKKEIKPTY